MNLRIFSVTIGLLAPLLLVACGGGAGEPEPVTGYPYDLQVFEDIGRDHLQSGMSYDDYNSNPPTSGPHSSLNPWGVFDEAVAKEVAVHNMEHAGVIVWYNCAGDSEPLSADDCSSLRNALSALVQPQVAEGALIVMTPYDDMPNRIALTGWQHLDAFDEYDETRVQTFIDTFECRFDPENVC